MGRGDVVDSPPSGAPGPIEDSSVALMAQYSMAPVPPTESPGSQRTPIEREMGHERVQAGASAKARRAAELALLSRRPAAAESARGAECDKAMTHS
eukprot:7563591-Pyramimonas_sp.AAC.1